MPYSSHMGSTMNFIFHDRFIWCIRMSVVERWKWTWQLKVSYYIQNKAVSLDYKEKRKWKRFFATLRIISCTLFPSLKYYCSIYHWEFHKKEDVSHMGWNFWIWKSVCEFIAQAFFHSFKDRYAFVMVSEGILLVKVKACANFLATPWPCPGGTHIRLFTESRWEHHRSRSRELAAHSSCNIEYKLLVAVKGRCKSALKFWRLVL